MLVLAVNKRLDEWVHEDQLDLSSLQAPKKDDKKLQGAAAHKVAEGDKRKSTLGRKRKQTEVEDSPGTPGAPAGAAGAGAAGADAAEVRLLA